MPPRIAIVGGGISGIMAGRELLRVGLRARIFEASNEIGGLWSQDSNRMWDSLKTNLSKHTCVVSSQDWPEDTPIFPSKHDVERYIRKLAENLEISVLTKVKKVEYVQPHQYKVSWQHNNCDVEDCEIYDGVIIASGFFSNCISPSNVNYDQFNGRILTSRDYREPSSFTGQKVIVVGGSYSGCEIAAEIATVTDQVYHIISHHAYVLPTFIPENPSHPASPFLPLDLVFYQLPPSRLKDIEDHLKNPDFASGRCEKLIKSSEEIQQTHEYFQKLLGINNDHLSALYSSDDHTLRVVISDHYRKMLKLNRIQMIPGRLLRLKENEIEIQQPSHEIDKRLLDADTCIFATGYKPDASVFCEHILSILEYQNRSEILANDESYQGEDNASFLPYKLYRDIFNPRLPGLYFVGMYKGPYFGVIELQAVSDSFFIPSSKAYSVYLLLETSC
jgi:cation diffusion facilitator CzcD-associated flavoprotein CzcO